MDTAEIRRRFVAHFEHNTTVGAHTPVPSASLLLDDPNLLFVNAGMVPFKPYFLGQEAPPYPRATSVQKCVRTPDIEDVGKTTRHGTFFEMCGNFSFGDYFKEGAIELAWDLVTRPLADGGWGLEESKLYPSVYEDDPEAVALWKKVTGLPEERIIRLGKRENYWSMGVPGPGGPCSEILYDRGPDYGPDGDFGPKGEDRYLEIWNLVFMQDELSAVRSKEDFDIAGSLPKKNIDTGMGLERVAFLLQGKANMYEIDVMFPVIQKAEELTGRRYGADHDDDVRFRVVADHVRSSMMLIGDGVTPGNEARGYVLRRLLRRAVRSMRLLGYEDPALPELFPISRDKMGETYTALHRDWERISTVAYAEEHAFRQTLRSGTTIFDQATAELKQAGGSQLSGDKAFALHDTYGFPIDLTLEMAAEQGLAVDEVGFRRLMNEQRQRAKDDAKAKKGQHRDASAYRQVADSLGRPVEFTGYDVVTDEASVRGLVAAGGVVSSAGPGDDVEIILDRTPFYAEGGGQLADQGVIELDNGARVEVRDVQSPVRGLIVHHATVLSGEVSIGLGAHALVDVERRRSISRSHTATHMVHKAFREALGETATQAGSENSPGRFRFDFSAVGAVPESVMADVEARVNEVVLDDLAVHAEVMSQADAVKSGAMALFGEKYGDRVRVVSVGDWARELCGGTHAGSSGKLGVVKLLGESSIGSGVRRVEALVGSDAYRFLAREHVLVAQLSDTLKVRPEQLPERVHDLVEKLREAEKEIERVRVGQLLAAAGELAAGAAKVGPVNLVAHRADGAGGGDVRTLALDVRGRLPQGEPGVVVVIGAVDGKVAVVAALNDEARARGLSANELVRAVGPLVGGKGGGKDDVAQGGGTDASRIDEAITLVTAEVGRVAAG
ncbi:MULTISPECIES: alanine--tRNA ligase [unclassified Nocardioides]|uniref:Alanine--tRNA ligase n=1 Tax=Nocardioides sp. (strain ATCC BAA-499 / JS614) TaxID=196162 RepID=SYA_NOCSJ|nr:MULTISPECIES: alanine--tRNA ligase [unclassified Nocardioides]A1SJC7.1 RecName: Full=Alanine--tRNA ligase; AltName: Full=Alanyl-tRNA synthetase; Short=AlaRS [Nocardioides sp. JS614]ABL81912.1 alanyl-tRNA synthetase [Nocardioides sp. JS614]